MLPVPTGTCSHDHKSRLQVSTLSECVPQYHLIGHPCFSSQNCTITYSPSPRTVLCSVISNFGVKCPQCEYLYTDHARYIGTVTSSVSTAHKPSMYLQRTHHWHIMIHVNSSLSIRHPFSVYMVLLRVLATHAPFCTVH